MLSFRIRDTVPPLSLKTVLYCVHTDTKHKCLIICCWTLICQQFSEQEVTAWWSAREHAHWVSTYPSFPSLHKIRLISLHCLQEVDSDPGLFNSQSHSTMLLQLILSPISSVTNQRVQVSPSSRKTALASTSSMLGLHRRYMGLCLDCLSLVSWISFVELGYIKWARMTTNHFHSALLKKTVILAWAFRVLLVTVCSI